MKYRILQIIPASGWYGLYEEEKNPSDTPEPNALACWALVEDLDWIDEKTGNPTRIVTGMTAVGDSTVDFCEEIGNFREYAFLGTDQPIKT